MYTSLIHVRGVVVMSCMWSSIFNGLKLESIWCGPIETVYQISNIPEKFYTSKGLRHHMTS